MTLQAKKLPQVFDIIVQNSRNSRLEQAKIVLKRPPISTQLFSVMKSTEQL